MLSKVFSLIVFIVIAITADAQLFAQEDSICAHGRKYDWPERAKFTFPAMAVTDAYKLEALHQAVPESWFIPYEVLDYMDSTVAITEEQSWHSRLCQYYFHSRILDYSEKKHDHYEPVCDSVLYKLKDTYVFDINGDGQPDVIHYPESYRAVFMGTHCYDIFLKQKDGYKLLSFSGFIVDIQFNADSSIRSFKTFNGPCCTDNHTSFNYYEFNKAKDDLVLVRQEEVLTCQFHNR